MEKEIVVKAAPTRPFSQLGVLYAAAALLALGISLPGWAVAGEPMRFAIEGVGDGQFGKAALAVAPGSKSDQGRSLCLTLGEGSADNADDLLTWMRSNSASAALATKPDATLTVLADQGGLKKGVYRLTEITVKTVRLAADRDLSDPRLEGAEINCHSVEVEL